MSIQLLFLLSIILGFIVQFLIKNTKISAIAAPCAYIAWSTCNEFLLPHQGRGVSFWPIDIFFAGPIAWAGSLCGAYLLVKLIKKDKISEGIKNDSAGNELAE